MVRWQWYALSELSAYELYSIMAARVQVFVVEQACVYQDLDGLDRDALHLVGWAEDSVAAYLRVLAPNVRFSERSIGRVITSQAFRGRGLGRELMAHALARLDREFPGEALRIGAQAHLQRFYGELGFETASAPYDEDGIPHVEMLRRPRLAP